MVEGPLGQGCRLRAPYEAIVFGGAVDELPDEIFAQLAEGGRLVAVVKPEGGVGRAMLATQTGGVIARRVIFDAATPLLPGFESEAGLCVFGVLKRSHSLRVVNARSRANSHTRRADRRRERGSRRSGGRHLPGVCGTRPDPGGAGPRRPARAQTLTQALAEAYNTNPQLLAQRALLRATDEQVPQALSGWRPTVNFTGQVGGARSSCA